MEGSLASLSPYNPTWRDKIAAFMMGDGKASPERRAFVEGLVGSTGLGGTGMSLADLTPAGAAFQANEAKNPREMSLAALGMLPGAGAIERAVPKVQRGIIAYHGSPHSFDRFDLSKIGTGEGAQAYGHGLYFADNEAVAKQYRDALSQGGQKLIGGAVENTSDPVHSAASLLFDHKGDRAAAIQELSSVIASGGVPRGFEAQATKALDVLKSGAQLPNVEHTSNPGHMYQVRINADPSKFIDLDGVGVTDFSMPRTPEEARKLAESGIPGIKYLDQGSRAAGDGSRNYVVFDDKLVDILRKYSLAGLGVGLPAFAAMQGAQPQIDGPSL